MQFFVFADINAFCATEFFCGLVVISYTEVASYYDLHSVDLFFSIPVFFRLTFTDHRVAGEGRGQFQVLSTTTTRFTKT